MAPQKRFKQCKRNVKICAPGISKIKRVVYKVQIPNKSSQRFEKEKTSSIHIGEDSNLGQNGLIEHVNLDEQGINADHTQGSKTLCNKVSNYELRKLREEDAWESIREKLRSAHFRLQFLPTSVCSVCLEKTSSPKKAVCRCLDCGYNNFFCIECATQLHSGSNYFHVLELWKDGSFVPLFSNNFALKPPGHTNCRFGKETKTIIFVDLQGRQHLKRVIFCKCQSEAESLVSMGFWPATVEKPTTAIDMRLLEFLSILLLECHTSLDKLCSSLSLWKNPLLPSYITNVYKILNNASFDEYRFFKHSLRTQIKGCALCPLPGESGTLIEIMDACFGFVRKNSAGSSVKPPRYEMTMFADQADVDNFIQQHSRDIKKPENPCNQYRAGEITESIRSKGRNEKYDEKAVFGRICRHGFPKGFISLKHGERIAYAVYELKRMIEPYASSDKTELKCMYDIACILRTHLQNNDCYELDDISKIQFGIPIFHAYVHIASCQVAYSPRRVSGFGLTDGEGIERLWSYLRKFSCMTKEMTPSRRTDVLTEALLHYARRVNRNQGRYLAQNFKKAQELREKTNQELLKCTAELPDELKPITCETIARWKEEENYLITSKRASSKSKSSWESDYAQLLWTHVQIRNSIASTDIFDGEANQKELLTKITRLEERLKQLERRGQVTKRWKLSSKEFIVAMEKVEDDKRALFLEHIHSLSVERHLQLMLKLRYSQGQKQAIRLARSVNKHTKKMKIAISKYNAELSLIKEHVNLPHAPVTFDDAKNPNGTLFSNYKNTDSWKDKVPFCQKRRIIELYDLKSRCDEEDSLLQVESKALLNSQLAVINAMTQKVQHLRSSANSDEISLGLAAFIQRDSLALKKELLMNKSVFQKFELQVPDAVSEPTCEFLFDIKLNHSEEFEEETDSELSDFESESDSECTFD